MTNEEQLSISTFRPSLYMEKNPHNLSRIKIKPQIISLFYLNRSAVEFELIVIVNHFLWGDLALFLAQFNLFYV